MAQATVPDGPFKQLTEEALSRLDACERQKREFNLDIREAYFFAAPHRSRTILSAQQNSPSKPTDEDALHTGVAMELSKDFLTTLINAFMPQAEPWAERRPGMMLSDVGQIAEAKKQINDQDPKIFDAIRASNLYEELPKLNPDTAVGTAALWVEDVRPAENVVVQAIPLHELEINVGPFGSIDDRFVVRHTKNRHVKALLGSTYSRIDQKCREEIEKKGNENENTIIRWGYWRKWDRNDDVVWQHVLMKDREVVYETSLVGEGSCPLIPFRFNPSPEWAYGQGPLIESLPDLRQLDDIQNKKIEHIDLTLAPPSGYPDDSFTAVADGVEAGKMYPLRPGTGTDVVPIFQPGSMEPAIYEVDALERTLQKRFYQNFPEQRGKTPPTATQLLEEMAELQRRIGTPGASFWQEGPAQIFLRFKYLLKQRGIVVDIKVNGKVVSLEPYNPAQRAAEQQEVAMFARFAEIVAPLLPEEWKLETDGAATMNALAEKMRVTGLWKRRDEKQKQQALNAISQLIGGQAPQASGAGPAGTL